MHPASSKLASGPALATLLMTLSATGCVLGPDYKAGEIAAGDRYGTTAPAEQTVATPVVGGEAQRFLAGRDVPQQWWTLFRSEKLNALVTEALAASPTVKSAQAALRQAQFTLKARGADLYPTAEVSAGGTRQKIDTGSFGNPGGGSSIYNLYNASVGVSYGIDLFGGTRRGIESAIAQADFQRYQSEAAYQTLIANVVTATAQEALLKTLIQGQQAIVADQEKLLKLTRTQFELGAIGKSDVLVAESVLASERAKLPALQLQITQAQNQLAVYLGKLPSEQVASNIELSDLTLPQDLPVSLPSTLVRRRPDVLAAEASLRAASANVGLAEADRFPKLALSASYGTQASKAGDLFKGDVWSLGANLTAPIFNHGALTALFGGAKAAYEQSEADYRLTVLNAFRNVADALRQIETDALQLQAQNDAATSAAQALKLAKLQYELGAASYLTLLSAQQQDVLARTGLVQAQAARLISTVALFQALGGGWNTEATATPVAAAP